MKLDFVANRILKQRLLLLQIDLVEEGMRLSIECKFLLQLLLLFAIQPKHVLHLFLLLNVGDLSLFVCEDDLRVDHRARRRQHLSIPQHRCPLRNVIFIFPLHFLNHLHSLGDHIVVLPLFCELHLLKPAIWPLFDDLHDPSSDLPNLVHVDACIRKSLLLIEF